MATYDAEYYAHYLGDEPYERSPTWLQLFDSFAGHIADQLGPESVLDAGCAMGMLVEALRDRGIEAYGFDISSYALSQAREDIREHLWEASLDTPLSRDYDLIVSIEVFEHLPPEETEASIENLCSHTDNVLFSSTPENYREATHFNVRPPEYWAELFARRGFVRDVDVDGSFISPWATLFRRRPRTLAGIVRDYERFSSRLDRENKALRQGLIEVEATLGTTRYELGAARAEAKNARTDAEDARSKCDESVAELDRMQGMLSWRIAQRGRAAVLAVLPFDSRRGRLIRRAIGRIAG